VDPERLGRLRDLADKQLAAWLGGKRGGLTQQPRTATGGNGELEPIQEDADDHDRTYVLIDPPAAQGERDYNCS
jgi:hypothetical protein